MRLLAFSLLVGVALIAQQPGTKDGKGPRRPMPEPKNLKVLKVPGSELIPLMRGYSASLGVQCNLCHVQGDFASDDKPEKLKARMMITMTQEINAKFAGGEMYVGCFTCHRGEKEPKMTPPPPPEGGASRPPA